MDKWRLGAQFVKSSVCAWFLYVCMYVNDKNEYASDF